MTNVIGSQGEKIAAVYLQRKGYEIIATNYRTRNGEIDIIAHYNKRLIFVEVKTLQNTAAWPEEAVTRKKLIALERTALHYCLCTNNHLLWSIEVVAITLRHGVDHSIVHYQNITRDG